MMIRNGIGVLAAVALAALPARAEDAIKPEGKAVAQAANAFAYELYAELRATPGNLFFSPASLHQALSMTYFGAKGRTGDELARLLHLDALPSDDAAEKGLAQLRDRRRGAPSRADDRPATRGARGALEGEASKGPKKESIEDILARLRAAKAGQPAKGPAKEQPGRDSLESANALWPDLRVELDPTTVNRLRKAFGVGVLPQDFARDPQGARRTINAEIAKQTGGEITDLLGPNAVDASTSLVLTNTIRFQGKWATPFDPRKTKPGTWTRPDGSTRENVPFMKTKAQFPYAEVDGVKLVELPYRGNLSMVIVLPPSAQELSSLEQRIAAGKLDALLAQMSSKKVTVTLPRFKSGSRFDLGATLQQMPATSKALGAPAGIPTAFAPAADFTRLAPGGGLRFSKVIHQATVEVDEQGTTATAATAVVATRGLSFDPEVSATHPFVYVIRDRTSGSIVFLGRLADPS